VHEVHDPERIGEVDLLGARVPLLGDARIDDSRGHGDWWENAWQAAGYDFSIVSRTPRLSYRTPFDTRKALGTHVRRLTLVLLTFLVALPLGDVRAQIIRQPPGPRLRDPQNWASAGVGLQQGWTVTDGSTGSRWELGDSQTYFASVEHAVAGGVTVGVRASTARTSLRYTFTGTGLVADADARVSQAFGVLHITSGRELHSVIELGAGATFYSDFKERGTSTDLQPRATDTDFTFVLGYGIGYAFSRTFQLDVVQDLATALHQKTGLQAGDNSTARISVTRLVARVALGG
jgi:hypothetical protein